MYLKAVTVFYLSLLLTKQCHYCDISNGPLLSVPLVAVCPSVCLLFLCSEGGAPSPVLVTIRWIPVTFWQC